MISLRRLKPIDETLKEIRIDHDALAEAVNAALVTNENRRKAVVLALTEDKDLPDDYPVLVSVAPHIDALADQIEARVTTLRTNETDETRKCVTAEARELRARKLLAQHELLVLDEIERKKKTAAYGLCVNDTTTNSITQKSTAVTKTAVSQKLKQRFKDELTNLAFHHVEVELKEAGGTEGVLYHKLILTRAPGVELPKVVSEGEQRCLSIAAFLPNSAPPMIRPASCLMILCLLSITDGARELRGGWCRKPRPGRSLFSRMTLSSSCCSNSSRRNRALRSLTSMFASSKGAGVCTEELPWVAMPVKKKVGNLKNEWQDADKLFRDGHQANYEKEAKYLYGLLRETWERAVEEVLLGGVIERFRPSVQTQQIGIIADIEADDCRTVETAMTKCSKWLPGHDQAAAARAPVPEPSELKSDIEKLENWVDAIRKRRR